MMSLRFVFFLSLVLPDVIKYLIAEKLKITGYKSRTKNNVPEIYICPQNKTNHVIHWGTILQAF